MRGERGVRERKRKSSWHGEAWRERERIFNSHSWLDRGTETEAHRERERVREIVP